MHSKQIGDLSPVCIHKFGDQSHVCIHKTWQIQKRSADQKQSKLALKNY